MDPLPAVSVDKTSANTIVVEVEGGPSPGLASQESQVSVSSSACPDLSLSQRTNYDFH